MFPGGVVEDADRDVERFTKRSDIGPKELENRLGGGLDPPEYVSFGVAAIRETFEEAGVVLFDCEGETGDELKKLSGRRIAGGLDHDWLVKSVSNRGWRLSFSRLFRWSNWISPKTMRTRYDTRFFLALLPEGQACEPDQRETVKGLWINPQKALIANSDGQVPLSPPTLVTLQQLIEFETLGALMDVASGRPWGSPMIPRLIAREGGDVILEPWDTEYHVPEIDLDLHAMADTALPAGADFSRLWHDGGIWRPVGRKRPGSTRS